MQRFQGVGPYATLGLDMVLAVVVGLLGGLWLDKKLGTGGWVTIVGFLFGVAAGFNILFKAARKLREDTEREDRQREKKMRDRGGASGQEPGSGANHEHRNGNGSSDK